MEGIPYENQRVMILSPHADDETIGCGGVIQKYIQHQSPVRVVIASFVLGEMKRFKRKQGAYKTYEGDTRLHEFQQVMNLLDIIDYHILYLEEALNSTRHSQLDFIPRVKLVESMEQHITEFRPTVLYIPSISKHQDHEALHKAALAAARPYFWNGTVYSYETDGELAFHPNLYVPLTQEEMQRKMEALQLYKSQIQENPHPVSTEALLHKAKFRGSQIHEPFAEAFQVVRIHG